MIRTFAELQFCPISSQTPLYDIVQDFASNTPPLHLRQEVALLNLSSSLCSQGSLHLSSSRCRLLSGNLNSSTRSDRNKGGLRLGLLVSQRVSDGSDGRNGLGQRGGDGGLESGVGDGSEGQVNSLLLDGDLLYGVGGLLSLALCDGTFGELTGFLGLGCGELAAFNMCSNILLNSSETPPDGHGGVPTEFRVSPDNNPAPFPGGTYSTSLPHPPHPSRSSFHYQVPSTTMLGIPSPPTLRGLPCS